MADGADVVGCAAAGVEFGAGLLQAARAVPSRTLATAHPTTCDRIDSRPFARSNLAPASHPRSMAMATTDVSQHQGPARTGGSSSHWRDLRVLRALCESVRPSLRGRTPYMHRARSDSVVLTVAVYGASIRLHENAAPGER